MYNPVTIGDSWLPYKTIDGQNTGVILKGAAGKVGGWYLFNNGSSVRYVKLYNKASTPTSSDTPALVLPLPAGGGANAFNVNGIEFNLGIGIRVVTGVADNDNTGPTTNDVIVNVLYN